MNKKYLIAIAVVIVAGISFGWDLPVQDTFDLKTIERHRVLSAADRFLSEVPKTITSVSSQRSAGGVHDFYSEGDYWWPDSANPDGPYVRHDGMTNPDNFVAHRKLLMHLSIVVPDLTSAYVLTHDERYAQKAVDFLRAWFVNEKTRMNPSLKYAQAIKGITIGRGIGIIDTIHLVEVARSVEVLERMGALSASDAAAIKKWFSEYLEWMTTSRNGIDEREAKNNHGTCWVMQVAAFAHLAGDTAQLRFCRDRFKSVLMPNQMALNGSFPLELERTKPYGYSLFNLDAMATVCQILSTTDDNLWKYTLPDGRNMHKAVGFMYPFILDKSKWPYPPDVMYDEYWPVRQPSLLFAGMAYDDQKYLTLWKKLDADPTNEEVIRNFPIRQPLLWIQ